MAVVNGRIPSALLTPLSTPGSLDPFAAASYERVRKLTGLKGTTNKAHAYRSIEAQEAELYRNYTTIPNTNRPTRYYEGRTWYRKHGHPTAAVPGTSKHGLALAVDWQELGGFDGAGYKKLARVAPDHGWSNAEGRSINEPWHWVYNRNNDKHRNDEDDMTPDEAQRLKKVESDVAWLVKRISGSATNDSITTILNRVSGAVIAGEDTAVQWSKWTGKRISGSTENESVTVLLNQVTAQNAAILAALGGGSVPAPAIDYNALAKAVNDDAARRLAE